MRKFPMLELIVFVCGAAVMVLELLGARMIAPWMGMTLFVWTGLIAVVLGALSAGYWLGGRMADRGASMKTLSLVVLAAGAYSALIPFLSNLALPLGVLAGWVWGPLLSALLLFAMPALLLGIVSPYAVRLRADGLAHVGGTPGSLYAISTVGSIAGTLAAGFFLIPSFGVKGIALGVGAALVLVALAGISERMRLPAVLILLIAAAAALLPPAYGIGGKVLFEKDSPYYKIRVIESEEGARRVLYLDAGAQAGIDPRNGSLLFDYTKASVLALALEPNPKRILFIGLGAGTEQTEFARRSGAEIETLEIDPELPPLAAEYFGFRESGRNRVSTGDGRVLLSKLDGTYDIVMVDVFNSLSIPAHLASLEAVREIKKRTGRDGVVVVNVVSSFEGRKSLMFRSLYKTYSREFRTIYVFPIGAKPDDMQNIMLIATDRDRIPKAELSALVEKYDPELKKWAEKNFEGGIETGDVPLLTDDYAPVDNLMAPLFGG